MEKGAGASAGIWSPAARASLRQAIETATGYRFFSALPKAVADAL